MTILQTLLAQVASLFPNNNKKQIKAADIRTMFNDFIASLNGDNLYDVPASGDTVTVTPAKLNTVVRFKGVIMDDFTLNVAGSSDLIPGKSTLVIIAGGDGTTSAKVITLSGNVQFMGCGSIQSTMTTPAFTTTNILIWDGVNFAGVDNC